MIVAHSSHLIDRFIQAFPRVTQPWAVVSSAFIPLLIFAVSPADAQRSIVGPSSQVTIMIIDSDLNANPLGVDRYEDRDFVTFRTSRDEVGEARPEIVETGPSTGVFEFAIQLKTDERACALDFLGDTKFEATGGSEPSVGACPGDVLMVEYEDETTVGGRSDRVDYILEVTSWDPKFTMEEDFYDAGDRITVYIFDPDADRDPDVADSLRDLRVFSDSDTAGRQFSAIETGRNTGTFQLSFMTATEPLGNSIVVKRGGELTVEYTDDFPADFSTSEEDKKFSFVMTIGSNVESAVTPSSPFIRNATGEKTTELNFGEQVVVSIELESTMNEQIPFVAIMEIRDSNGMTVSVGWQAGTLGPGERTEIGFSWIPDQPDKYEARMYLINNLADPQVLSPVKASELTVDGN